jgi:hypothetical protein
MYNSPVPSAMVYRAGISCVSWNKHMIGNKIINGTIAGYNCMIKTTSFLKIPCTICKAAEYTRNFLIISTTSM